MMPTAVQRLEPQMENWAHDVLARMPKKRGKRLYELIGLLVNCDDLEERGEIIDVIVETIKPDFQRVLSAKPVALSDTVDSDCEESLDQYRKKVGRNVRQLRVAKEWSQVQLAEAAGIPQSHVSRIEQGVHTSTDITIARLAKALCVEPDQIDPSFGE